MIGLADTASLMMEGLPEGAPLSEQSRDDLIETLKEIRQAGQRASVLTQKLLAVGRQQLVEMKPLPLNDVIREMSSVLSGVLKSVEKPVLAVRLDHRLGVDLPLIKADRSQVEQILLNLTVNARDAILKMISEGVSSDYVPVITIKTFYNAQSAEVNLEVQDNGSGMTEEVRKKAFDPFFTTKEVGRGTGLGLASVYGILQQSRAQVHIETELGKGTSFLISFPTYEERGGITEEGPVSKVDQPKNKILYVEDDIVIRSLVKRNLQLQGFEVTEAENGLVAWEKFQNTPEEFSLILTDLLMPKMSGVELSRKIKELKKNQPILCVSGYSNEDTGGLPVLHKPFTIQKLSQKIEELLARRNSVFPCSLPLDQEGICSNS